MRLSHILGRSGTSRIQEPLFVDETSGKSITHASALKISREHKRWIDNEVRSRIHRNRLIHAGRASDDPSNGGDVNILISYLSLNTPDLILSVLACTDSFTPALLNARWTAGEIADAIRPKWEADDPIDLTMIVYGPGFERLANDAASVLGRGAVALPLPSLSDTCVRPDGHLEERIEVQSEESGDPGEKDAVILFTSGTSGGPRGVRLSHFSLVIQSMAKLLPPCGYNRETRMIGGGVPFFHVGGMSSILAVIMAGGCLVFPSFHDPSPSFRPTRVLRTISSQMVNTLVVVPAMLHSLLSEMDAAKGHGSYAQIGLILVGGQSLSPPQLERTAVAFPNARIVQTYACTEAGSSITFLDLLASPSTQVEKGFDVGLPPPHIELAIHSHDESGRPRRHTRPGEVGTISTRGRHVMNGYWERGSGRTPVPRTPAGAAWLHTNDLGYLDQHGHLFFCGRSTDVIRTGGETVFASEVERAVLLHRGVNACAVFALEDEKFGECVSLVIVPQNTEEGQGKTKLNRDTSNGGDMIQGTVESETWKTEIRNHCAQCGLAGYKRPRRVFLLRKEEDLPRNSSGKILKRKLLDMVLKTETIYPDVVPLSRL